MLSKSDLGDAIEVKPLNIEGCVSNADGKFREQEIADAYIEGLQKYLEKKKFTVSRGSNVVIDGELTKVDIGNRFLRYVSIGFAGKVAVAVTGSIKKGGEVLESFNIEVPHTSTSWIHTSRFLCKGAAKGCALKVSKLIGK